MGRFYSAVEGDPLSSGFDSFVLPSGVSAFFDEEGHRTMAFIGGDAYCGKCKSIGKIIGGSGCSESARLYDRPTSQRQAVAGDFVQCRCDTRPIILARYGKGWVIEDSSGMSYAIGLAPSSFASTAGSAEGTGRFDEMFILRDDNGDPIPDQRFRIEMADGAAYEGTTNDQGETVRICTDASTNLEIELVV